MWQKRIRRSHINIASSRHAFAQTSKATRYLAAYPDYLVFAGICLGMLGLYGATLLPGIGIGDTAELQRVAPTLGLAHPTGYPLYTLLGWLWTHMPLGGTPAWRMNLFSAVTAALTSGVIYLIGRMLGQWRVVATAAALSLATGLTFWSQATIAEVYSLALLIQATLFLTLLRWRDTHAPFWLVGVLFGLGLAHHRAIILLVPGIGLFLLSSRWPRPAELGRALIGLVGALLLYLYMPLRTPPWEDPWQLLWRYASGAGMAAHWLDLERLLDEGIARPLGLVRQFIWPQMTVVGALLALAGAVAILWRDRAAAALLLVSYGVVLFFCSAYYVIDIDAFLLPAHLIAALLLGEGAMLLLRPLPHRFAAGLAWALLALPIALTGRNLATVSALNSSAAEESARNIMQQALPRRALLIDERNSIERLRYLQAVEGQHPDLELRSERDVATIQATLAEGRAVYLLEPDAALGLSQWPEGILWRVGAQPLTTTTSIRDERRWAGGIQLAGYTLNAGPYQPGAVVPITPGWQVHQPPQRDYTLFVHLVGADGTIYGQQDRAPGIAPTSQWQPGMTYVDLYGPVLDANAPPGRYRVLLGWYDPATLERLPVVAGGTRDGAHTVELGEILVGPP